ncbi:MAG: PAS domain S-box protein [Desulfobacter sp.]|nr:PAS domain S-box protein [Desulfobacter sp.]
MTETGGRLVLDLGGEPVLGRFAFFPPWKWYILAVDPMEEVYGVSNRMRPYLYALIALAAVIISLALMLLTRRLTRPLEQLVRGAEEIGKGNLNTQIPIHAKDEFGHLAREFNQMTSRLKQTLTRLQYSEEHFRALIENANDMIWILDKNGRFIYVSPSTQRIMGYDPKTLLKQPAVDYAHPDDRDALPQRYETEGPNQVKGQTIIYRFKHKDGHWCTLESTSKNLMDHPAISGIVINSRNITKRRQAEKALKLSHQELERANQAKNNFLANVSHEIRTPLNSVIGFSELLSSMITEKQQSDYLAAITTAGKNLLALINDILDLSKMEAGKFKIHNEPVSLKRLFSEIEHLFRVKTEIKDLAFSTHLPPEMPGSLILDEMRLRQLITNLIGNAIKFTEKGSISLKAFAKPAVSDPKNLLDLDILIQDTGIGISKEKQAFIFESFQQESAGTSRRFGGTGLGLAICKQLSSLMGGRISVSSTPGRGSLFTIHLPGIKIGHGRQPAQPKPIGLHQDLKTIYFSGETVLVADDHQSIRFMVRQILERVNLNVIEAENGRHAVETALTQMPKLILMDAKMPILSGMDAAAQLKANPDTQHIPICLMTASVHHSSEKELSAKKIECCLVKPLGVKDIIQTMTRFIPGPVQKQPRPWSGFKKLDMEKIDSRITKKLNQDILSHLPEIQDVMKISDIKIFAGEIKTLGSKTGCRELENFGTDLVHQTQTFDIEEIHIRLAHLAKISREIQKTPG